MVSDVTKGSTLPFCKQCGSELGTDVKFCTTCGTPTTTPPTSPTTARQSTVSSSEMREDERYKEPIELVWDTPRKKKTSKQNTVQLARKAPKPPKLRDLVWGVIVLVGGAVSLVLFLNVYTNGFGFMEPGWYLWVDGLFMVYGVFSIWKYVRQKTQYQEIENTTEMRSTQSERVTLGDERREKSQCRSTGLRGSFPLDAETVNDQVTKVSPGVYALGTKDGNTFHVHCVGRSDIDVKAELREYVGKYDRFKFEYSDSPEAAFLKECELYHAFRGSDGKLDNKTHPDKQQGAAWQCPMCASINNETPTIPPRPNVSNSQTYPSVQPQTLHVSALWWLVPFFFGFLGGIIAYFAVKQRNRRTANRLLIFGILWTILPAIVGAAIYYASLPP